jgi:hypothetical protein
MLVVAVVVVAAVAVAAAVMVVVVGFVVVQVHVTVNYTKILSVAQGCFYGEFMSTAATQIICTIFIKK